jgi:hypothetical protein
MRAIPALTLLCALACDYGPVGPGPTDERLLAACRPPRDVPSGMISTSGIIAAAEGYGIPAEAKVMVVWYVSATSPDYAVKHGQGTSHGRGFQMCLPTPPSDDALNAGAIGVGRLFLVPSSLDIDDGVRPTDLPGAMGGSGRHAIIYRKPGTATDLLWWMAAFPEGYACGLGVPAPEGETFDGYQPVDCGTLGIEVNDLSAIDWVNWT